MSAPGGDHDGLVEDFGDALAVADAVLFEGYLLYPYRASAQKNRLRWQFGVLNPRAASEAGSGEPWAAQTECLVEAAGAATVRVAVRFFQVEHRTGTATDGTADGTVNGAADGAADGGPAAAWDEGTVRTAEATIPLDAGEERVIPFAVPAGFTAESDGRVARQREALSGLLRVVASRFDGPYPLWKLRVRVENVTDFVAPGPRDTLLRHSLVATHTLLRVRDGAFVSLLEPPEWAKAAAAGCDNQRTWPVLVGEGRSDTLLSSPIILYDYPAVAPESPGETFDLTEIDEILTLRTMTLTDDEKREARATDPRAAALIDRVDGLPGEVLERLHGAVRYLRETGGAPPQPDTPPWWDPGADASVSPETDTVTIDGIEVGRGTGVRLRPSLTGTDAQDMFLTGRQATVQAVLLDVDGNTHLAVTLDDDPMAELQQGVGRYLYFSPAEVEPLPREGTVPR